jgi:hypothetical protein
MLVISGAAFTAYYLTRQLPNRLWLIILVPVLGIGLAVTGTILNQIISEASGIARSPNEIAVSIVINSIWAVIIAALAVPISLWRYRRKPTTTV